MEQLFKNYLQNQCTLQEIEEVLNHLTTPQGRQLMERLLAENAFEEAISPPSLAQQQQGWERLSTSISSTPISATQGRVLSLWARRALRVAAVVLPLLVCSYWIWQNYFQVPQMIVVQTAYAEVKTIVLPDQSVVTLNGNSVLKYNPKWSALAAREVWLRGEGFFDVTHQHNHQKFLVHTHRAHTVEVLGTEFNISDRTHNTLVALKSGKIKLTIQQKATARSVVMKPGQVIAIDSSARRINMALMKTENMATWRANKLVFEGTSLTEVVQILKETYNLEVIVANQQLLQERVTGTIPSGNIDELLSVLSTVLHVKYKQEKNQVKFY